MPGTWLALAFAPAAAQKPPSAVFATSRTHPFEGERIKGP
jgi:hypothetical protein